MTLSEFLVIALAAGIPAAILLWIYFASVGEQQRFEESAPPISEDEFMALLPAGTNRDMALKVRRIVADQFNVDYARIHPHCTWSDLGAD